MAVPSSDHATTAPATDTPILDYNAFRHIFSLIVSVADVPALLVIRATCHGLRKEVDHKRLAYHVVLEDGHPRTLDGGISLRGRPELIEDTRIIDLKGGVCNCPGMCNCLAALGRTIESIAPDRILRFDMVRVFTSMFGSKDACRMSALQADVTVYMVDVFPNCPCCIFLPVKPIGGSETVVINLLFDPSNRFVPKTTFLFVGRAADVQYDLVFTPSSDPAVLSPPGSHYMVPFPYYDDSIRIADSVLATLAVSFANQAPGARLLVVGSEHWTRDWFKPTVIRGTEDASDGEWKEAIKTIAVRVFTLRFLHGFELDLDEVLNVEVGGYKYETTSAAAERVQFMTTEEYEEWWDEREPGGMSLVVRP